MMVKSGLEVFILTFTEPLQKYLLKVKNVNFKTRDFSPLIERVLGGVTLYGIRVDVV